MNYLAVPTVPTTKRNKKDLSDTSSYQGKDKAAQKRRGRKRERDDLYFIKAQERINELKRKLKTAKQDGMSVKER